MERGGVLAACASWRRNERRKRMVTAKVMALISWRMVVLAGSSRDVWSSRLLAER